MHVHCTHERIFRTEYSQSAHPHHRPVPGVDPRDLSARRTHSHLTTAGGYGRTTLLRARHQHPDRDRRVGAGDPLHVEGANRIDPASRVPRARPRSRRRRDRGGVGPRFLCLAGRSVLEPSSLRQRLRPGAGELHSRGTGLLGRDSSLSQAVLQEDRGRWVAPILAAVIASVFFGVYHFAHSPPFNTVPVVVLLSVVGLVTSLFFFVSRDAYGTIAFHNFLDILGVIRALDATGNLSVFERPMIPLLVMAVIAIALLIAAHVFWINSGAAPTPTRVR